MGYTCRKQNVLTCLAALEATLRRRGLDVPAGRGVDAALDVYEGVEPSAADVASG